MDRAARGWGEFSARYRASDDIANISGMTGMLYFYRSSTDLLLSPLVQF